MAPATRTDRSTRPTEARAAATGDLRQAGSELVSSLGVLIKSALLFDLDNEVLARPRGATVAALARLESAADEETSLRIVDGAMRG